MEPDVWMLTLPQISCGRDKAGYVFSSLGPGNTDVLGIDADAIMVHGLFSSSFSRVCWPTQYMWMDSMLTLKARAALHYSAGLEEIES